MFRAASEGLLDRVHGALDRWSDADDPASPTTAAGRSPAADLGERPRVAVEVESGRPARVTVDLRPHARGARLYLDRLHARGANTPPLLGTVIDTSSDDHLVVIRLRIDPDQPTGVYNGVIIDEATSAPAGTISVAIQPARDASHPESRE
jgi:hypothetical protein